MTGRIGELHPFERANNSSVGSSTGTSAPNSPSSDLDDAVSSSAADKSEIGAQIWGANAKEQYFGAFFDVVVNRVVHLVPGVNSQSSSAQLEEKRGSRLIAFEHNVSSLIDFCDTYLDMPLAPFSIYVKQLHTELKIIKKQKVNEDTLSSFCKEIRELCLDILIRMRLIPRELHVDDTGRPRIYRKEFSSMARKHLRRLKSFYYDVYSMKSEMPNYPYFIAYQQLNNSPFSYLYFLFVQLTADCNEYLDAKPLKESRLQVVKIKDKLEDIWSKFIENRDISNDLIDLRMFIDKPFHKLKS